MKKFRISAIVMMALSIISLTSCFDLEEKAYSEITTDSFAPTEADVAALLASAYTPLSYVMNWQGLFDLQEEPGDVIITPTRPNGWDDGGTYRRMHQHGWDNQQWQPESVYEMCYEGINNANRVKDQIDKGELTVEEPLKTEMLAELRALRAFWYSILLDTHGNVPLVTAFTDEMPTQATRKEVFDFVTTEIEAVIGDLSESRGKDTYGRINKWAAYMILARTYLNAGVYTGTPQWQKAMDAAQAVIDCGLFSLAPKFSDNFTQTNDWNSPEFIFAIPYDAINCQFTQHAKWYPPVSKQHFGWSYQCWGGSCANPQFINSYQEGDTRLEQTWLMGPQYRADDASKLVWTCENYLPSLTCNKDNVSYANIDWGYRVMKYEPSITSSWGWGNDVPYFRYTETLMIKAECELRLGKNEQDAADIITSIRSRVFEDASKAAVTVADLKADTKVQYGYVEWGDMATRTNEFTHSGDQSAVVLGGLYDEWGWEFACEFQRRTHMIRFGTFSTKDWFNHSASDNNIQDGHTSIFPIYIDQLSTNPNLKQNPGY